ncbi:MAG: hypothetical protein KGR26_00940, partial [Cyanobacteria bacterium REEB65]|nr:hypothetical protein [Cyanobacteria bacterium REEB65]
VMTAQAVDPALLARVGQAIGVDAFFYEAVASLDQHVESGPTYSTVEVNRESGYGTVTQNPSSATITTVRLGARLYDASTGMVVWSASKVYATADNLAYSGFTPIFSAINRDFVQTIPLDVGTPAPLAK